MVVANVVELGVGDISIFAHYSVQHLLQIAKSFVRNCHLQNIIRYINTGHTHTTHKIARKQ